MSQAPDHRQQLELTDQTVLRSEYSHLVRVHSHRDHKSHQGHQINAFALKKEDAKREQ